MLEYLCYMNNRTSDNSIVVMAKHWQAGPVKTRLAASIGDAEARRIYRGMASDFWQRLQNDNWQRHLWSAAGDSTQELGEWLSHYDSLSTQQGRDLGQRMLHALRATPYKNWIAVSGTDAPDLHPDYISELCSHLSENDVAIAPTFDGGYAFMAMHKVHPQLFDSIDWSTEHVLQQTIAAADSCNLKVHLGPLLNDLDTIEDLKIFEQRGFDWARLSS